MSEDESWRGKLHDYQCSKCKEILDISWMASWKRCPKCGNRTMIRRFGQKGIEMATQREEALDYKAAMEIWEELGEKKEAARVRRLAIEMATQREEALDFEAAIKIWEELGEISEAARVRKLKAEMGSVKVAQKVIHGDTIVKDSVLNRANVGGSSKMQELEKLATMKKDGLIDDDEFKQMKKEILGK